MAMSPNAGVETSSVTVRDVTSLFTMFTASPNTGTAAGLQLPGTLQLPVPSAQFLATAEASQENARTKVMINKIRRLFRRFNMLFLAFGVCRFSAGYGNKVTHRGQVYH